jgi:TRAP transporter TAXI family solute receptor
MKLSFVVLLALLQCAGGYMAQAAEPAPASGPAARDLARGAPTVRRPAVHDSDAQQRRALRSEVNDGLVGMIAGAVEGADLRIAAELAFALGTAEKDVRVLPMAGSAGIQNVKDLVFARGIDLGIVQSDVLAYLKGKPMFPELGKFLQYIAKLDDQEIHLLAAKDVNSVGDLAFKKVNVGISESGSSMTANLVFDALGISIEPTTYDQPHALDKLKRGEISALFYVTGKPAPLFEAVKPEDNLHFLAIPANDLLKKSYAEASLTAEDYPGLVRPGETVNTLSVGSVLAVYNWTPGTERYENVTRFVDAFCRRLAELQEAPNHPKWRNIDLSAEVPGWTRFARAEECVRRADASHRVVTATHEPVPGRDKPEALFKDFSDHLIADFLKERGPGLEQLAGQ